MMIVAEVIVVLVALLHVYFMVLEMFFWDKPLGMRIFSTQPDYARASKVLAANQGLYNGFLAAGLFWGLMLGQSGNAIKIFFLCCVTIAGIFGALTASKRIFFIQALPAMIALALVFAA